MAITSQAQYQQALRDATDLSGVARTREIARIQAEWSQFQATQNAALSAAAIAAEKARIAELDNVARAKAQAALDAQVRAQTANVVGVTLTGNSRADQVAVKVGELLLANPSKVLPDTTTLTDEQFFNEWRDLGAASQLVSDTSAGQGNRVLSQAIIEESNARAELARLGGAARYQKIERELYTPQRAKVLEIVQLINKAGDSTYKRKSWQSLLTIIAIAATVGYAAGGTTATSTGATGTATAGTGGAVGATAETGLTLAEVGEGIATASELVGTAATVKSIVSPAKKPSQQIPSGMPEQINTSATPFQNGGADGALKAALFGVVVAVPFILP